MEHREFQLTVWCEACAMHIEYVDVSYPKPADNCVGAYKEETTKVKALMVAHSKTRSHRRAVKAEEVTDD